MWHWRLALAAAMAQLAFVAVPPLLVCGTTLTPTTETCLILLALAAVAETLAVERRGAAAEGRHPALAVLSALALLCGFWLALGEHLAAPPAVAVAMPMLGAIALLGGIALRVAAIVTLGVDFVSEHRAARLVTSGLYGALRHPSEAGQLLLAGGVVLMLGSFWSAAWLLWVLMPLTLLRLRQEEAVLRAGFAGYEPYIRRVDGLLPLRFVARGLWRPLRG